MPPLEEAQTTHLSADRADSEAEGITRFQGNVMVERGGSVLTGNEGLYDKRQNSVTLQGDVQINGQEMVAWGERAHVRLDEQSGQMQQGRYHFRSLHAFGRAETITIIDPDHTTLEQASYTTCMPGHEDWLLKARSVELDYATNTGEAYHTTLSFKGVPFLYTPYINFPLEGRKTGLLAPTIATSSSDGTDIRLPYYWNIAPHRDATTTPRNISGRGQMLETEFRYLNPASHGQANIDYLWNDKLLDEEDRHFYHYQHTARLSPGWRTDLLFNEVSDSAYFDDLGDSQVQTSQSHLDRRLDLRYQSRHWQFLGRVQNHQTLSGTSPYHRLPQLKLNGAGTRRPGRLYFDFSGEAVTFDHEQRLPTGTRLDLYPGVSLPLEGAAWFVTPRVALRHTQYALKEYDAAIYEERIERTLPIASLDGGLFFERDFKLGDSPMVQTLEPRLYYLHVPYKDQDDLPRFDTSEHDLSFNRLFNENRFNGADRVGDANQLTVALTSRFLDGSNGAERLRASLGQIRYFRDREVTLNARDSSAEQTSSAYVGELAFRPFSSLRFTGNARWNPHTETTEIITSRLRYQPDNDHSVYLGYSLHEEDALEQADLAVFWPVTRRWQFLGRWQYDLVQERNLDVVSGLEYRSCCWAARIVARSTLNTTSLEHERSVFFTLELKGLSTIGNRIDAEIEEGLLGIER